MCYQRRRAQHERPSIQHLQVEWPAWRLYSMTCDPPKNQLFNACSETIGVDNAMIAAAVASSLGPGTRMYERLSLSAVFVRALVFECSVCTSACL